LACPAVVLRIDLYLRKKKYHKLIHRDVLFYHELF
jgi:hypothetical protein